MNLLVAFLCMALSATSSLPYQKGAVVTNHAKGTFDVKVIPQAPDDAAGGPFSRLFLDKQFHGDLDGSSKGQMLASEPGPMVRVPTSRWSSSAAR